MSEKVAKPNGRIPTVNHFKERILTGLREGMSYARACKFAGVKWHNANSWRKKGEAATSGLYFDFLNDVKKAIAEGEEELIAIIKNAARGGSKVIETKQITGSRPDGCYEETVITEKVAPPNWQPAAWLLARRNVKKWGNEAATKKADDQGSEKLTPEEFAERTAEARKQMVERVPEPIEKEPVDNKEPSKL